MLRRFPIISRRLAGAIVSAVLALQPVAALAATLVEPAASCCCGHNGEAHCHCPVCTHARELEEGHPLLKTCGGAEAAMSAAWPAHAVEPVTLAMVPPRAHAPLPDAGPPPLHEDPDTEATTPPPRR